MPSSLSSFALAPPPLSAPGPSLCMSFTPFLAPMPSPLAAHPCCGCLQPERGEESKRKRKREIKRKRKRERERERREERGERREKREEGRDNLQSHRMAWRRTQLLVIAYLPLLAAPGATSLPAWRRRFPSVFAALCVCMSRSQVRRPKSFTQPLAQRSFVPRPKA